MTEHTSFEHLKFTRPEIWREVVKAMGEMEALVWNDPRVTDDLTRAEGLRYLTRLIAGALPITMEESNPNYPRFLQLLSTRLQWGLPSADCHYQWAPVHGDNVYRVSGDRGTAKMFDIESRRNHFARLGEWTLHARLPKAVVGPNNHVDIVLSRKRPADARNWLELPEGPGELIFRQYFYDWNTEQAARLVIVNENAVYPPPPLTQNQIRERCALFCDFLRQATAIFRKSVETYYAAPPNTLAFDGIDYGWRAIQYGKGPYECALDEALILECKLPNTEYWNVQIGSHWWEARDYHLRQTSLNGHQARVEEGGVFRAVISHQDPGVANWLDAGGHDKGLISIRYYEADSLPVPTIRKVKLAQLGDALPASAARVSTQERQQILRERAWSMPRLGRD
ncbi:hypothetical protein [Panacagrimonas sp.]|uniref:hypothetical protein n=1 Tax=Panacagrimonas sp. TaxID=2480088 RepID=UPI003B51704C